MTKPGVDFHFSVEVKVSSCVSSLLENRHMLFTFKVNDHFEIKPPTDFCSDIICVEKYPQDFGDMGSKFALRVRFKLWITRAVSLT